MKKAKKYSRKFYAILFLFILIIVLLTLWSIGGLTGLFITAISPTDTRPKHCDEGGCVPSSVFSKLPTYPSDLPQIYQLVYFGRLAVLENFTENVPDENYYKQPEFYPTWPSTGVGVYSWLRDDQPVIVSYPAVMGYGAYPGDQVLQVERGGGIVEVISFWHAGWGVINWQGMNLIPAFPNQGTVASFDVIQNPDEVSNYFDVKISPTLFLLGPDFPSFESDWAQKVKIKISIDPNTPAGKYLIGIVTTNVPPEQNDEWVRKYRLGYISPAGVGVATARPTQQILIEVV